MLFLDGSEKTNSAAEADAAEKWYPEVETIHVDVMDLVPKLFRAVYTDTYIKIVE